MLVSGMFQNQAEGHQTHVGRDMPEHAGVQVTRDWKELFLFLTVYPKLL